MPEPISPMVVVNTGPDWTWYCDATIAFHVDNPHARLGRCRCGWKTSVAHPSQMRQLQEMCDKHREISARRRDEYLASRPRDPRAGQPGYLEEVDAQIFAGLDEIRAIADEMEHAMVDADPVAVAVEAALTPTEAAALLRERD